MIQQVPVVVKQIKGILPDLAWPVREITSSRFNQPSGKINRSIGCYTTRPRAEIRGAWVGFVDHQKLQRGVYASITLPPQAKLLKVLRNGFREAPFGPHPFIKQLITEKEIIAIRKKHGRDAVARKLKALLKKTYPFKKIK